MSQARITSTTHFDERLFEEYFAAKDRPLNRRDALVFGIGVGILFGIWFWTAVLYNFNLNALGWVFGIICGAFFVVSLVEAWTGATIFWPRRLWTKTYQRFFMRHGADCSLPRPWSCTLRSYVAPNSVEMSYLAGDASHVVLSQSYKKFERIMVTKHLIVLITRFDLGNPFSLRSRSPYPDKLMDRELTEDAIFCRGNITDMQGKPMSDEDFINYVGRKIMRR